ncbi:MAG TPA: hypothetical protein VFF67_09675 [Thermoplasmata archaeon]|nr:hypothetical protein [Thermoplasmata archaeon]
MTIERAAGSRILNVEVPSSARVRDVLRLVGQPAEGSCALVDGASVPLDGPLPVGGRLTVVPTFSGG